MSDDAFNRARDAVTAWITKGDAKAERQLREALADLSATPAMHRHLKERSLPTKRRKAA